LGIFCSLLAYKTSAEESIVALMGVSLNMTLCFSPVVFNSLCPVLFDSLAIMCYEKIFSGHFFFFGILYTSYTWIYICFPKLGKFFGIILLSSFSMP
jgi:hypothetical protein